MKVINGPCFHISLLKGKYSWRPISQIWSEWHFFILISFSWCTDAIKNTLASDPTRLTFFSLWQFDLKSSLFFQANHGHQQQRETLIYQDLQFSSKYELEEWGSLWSSNRKGKGCDGTHAVQAESEWKILSATHTSEECIAHKSAWMLLLRGKKYVLTERHREKITDDAWKCYVWT